MSSSGDSGEADLHQKQYEQLLPNLRTYDPPVAEGALNQDALRAFGLHDFVNLSLSSSSNQERQLIAEFISSYMGKGYTRVRRKMINTQKTFRGALKLPPSVPTEAPPGMDLTVLRTTALSLMKTYVFPMYKSERLYPKAVKTALEDIQSDLAYRVDFAELIYQAAIHEIKTLTDEATKKFKREWYVRLLKTYEQTEEVTREIKSLEGRKYKYNWSCRCSSFWHKLMEVNFGTYRFANLVGQGKGRQEQDDLDGGNMSTSEESTPPFQVHENHDEEYREEARASGEGERTDEIPNSGRNNDHDGGSMSTWEREQESDGNNEESTPSAATEAVKTKKQKALPMEPAVASSPSVTSQVVKGVTTLSHGVNAKLVSQQVDILRKISKDLCNQVETSKHAADREFLGKKVVEIEQIATDLRSWYVRALARSGGSSTTASLLGQQEPQIAP